MIFKPKAECEQSLPARDAEAAAESNRISLSLGCYGVGIRLETTPDVLARLTRPILPVNTPHPVRRELMFTFENNATGFLVSRADGCYLIEDIFEKALALLESAVHEAIAESSQDFVFVHAGVVAWKGKAILLPGRSFCGKSSLVRALVAAGATYYSDEYAVLDQSGRLYPFPRALRLRADVEQRWTGRPEILRPMARLDSVPVGLVLSASYQNGQTWDPRPLTPGELFFALLANTVNVRSQAGLAMKALQSVSASAPGFAGVRDEAEPVAIQILRLFEEMSSNTLQGYEN
jgi:hypothetical protein